MHILELIFGPKLAQAKDKRAFNGGNISACEIRDRCSWYLITKIVPGNRRPLKQR